MIFFYENKKHNFYENKKHNFYENKKHNSTKYYLQCKTHYATLLRYSTYRTILTIPTM